MDSNFVGNYPICAKFMSVLWVIYPHNESSTKRVNCNKRCQSQNSAGRSPRALATSTTAKPGGTGFGID